VKNHLYGLAQTYAKAIVFSLGVDPFENFTQLVSKKVWGRYRNFPLAFQGIFKDQSKNKIENPGNELSFLLRGK
jgi:hypothetical protein